MNEMFEKNILLTSDGPNVEYSHKFGNGRRWSITASKFGVSMSESALVSDKTSLDYFARALADAFRDYMSLVRTGKPFSPPQPTEAPSAEA